MTTPTCGITHDVVIYDGLGNLDPVGLIVKPFSYRVSEAPSLVPRMAMGDPRGTDYLGYTSWVQEDFRGGRGQWTSAPMPANNRYAGGRGLIPDRAEGYLGIHVLPWGDSICQVASMCATVSYPGLNTLYGHRQRRWWYLTGINFGVGAATDRIIAWRGAWIPGRIGATGTNRVAAWGGGYPGGDGARSTIDACRYSGCAIVAVQRSVGGYIKPNGILVHYHSTWDFLPYGSTSAAALATYDGHLWRADYEQPRIAWYDIESVNDSINPTWSDFIDVGSAGSIQQMTAFMGRLFIAKSNGVWCYEAGRTYQVVDLTERAFKYPYQHNDFSIFLEAHGALYWNIGNRLMRYTAGGLLEELAGHLDDAPVAAMPVRRGLAIITPYRVWVLDVFTGGLYWISESHKRALHGVGAHAGYMWVGPYQCSWWDQARLAVYTRHGQLAMAGEPEFVPRNHSYYTTSDQIYLTTSFVDLGRPGLIKSWRRVVVRYKGLVNSSWPGMHVYYRRDPEGVELTGLGTPKPPRTGFAHLGTLDGSTTVQDTGVAVFPFAATVTSRAIKIMVVIPTGPSFKSSDPRPEIYGIEVEGEPLRTVGRTQKRKRYCFNAVVTDDMELLTGALENSCAHITSALYSMAGTGTTHIVALPYPPPVGHTVSARVEMGPTGAVVPVLPSSYSQCPSGCPGSEVSLVVTEV